MWCLCGPTAINEKHNQLFTSTRPEKLLQMYQQHEVITSKDVLSCLSGGEKKKVGNGERKSNNPV